MAGDCPCRGSAAAQDGWDPGRRVQCGPSGGELKTEIAGLGRT